ncbi:MAG: DUF1343 domain-containing protein [Armatimonadetes bacterium]|nr:DUF1343 domain-containing protein [Armatimonadota bacterium]MDE2205899.1 DUF1343 domain-containing protein [Armatimonadota bacterium]
MMAPGESGGGRRFSRRGLLGAACAWLPARAAATGTVLPGLEVARQMDFRDLAGSSIGLITNPTGIAPDGASGIDLLAKASNVHLKALFGPEHGLRGTAGAGAAVKNGRDVRTGLPIYSLYGVTRRPSPEMLKGIDTIVYDIQDVGSRSYTFISTMGLAMQTAAQHRLRFVVLDRPSPAGANRIEGNIPGPQYHSFVGSYPIPYCYGLTVGELARMINGSGWMGDPCHLQVIPMEGYNRRMFWRDTHLPWRPTSPHIPTPEAAWGYAATGIMGELPGLSIGIDTPDEFLVAGRSDIDSTRFADALNARALPGVRFLPFQWRVPGSGSGAVDCGVRIRIDDPASAQLTRINFELMVTARRLVPHIAFFARADQERMFDMVCGTDVVRRRFQAGADSAEIWAAWNTASSFAAQRKPWLLYA